MTGTSLRERLISAGASGGAAAENAAKTLSSRFLGGVPGDAEPSNRWLTVTINCPAEQLADLPMPVARLRGIAEVRVRPAPGGRGSELAMRLLEQPPAGAAGLPDRLTGTDPRRRVRAALREAKSLCETGEVIEPDDPTNHPTPTGRLFDLAAVLTGREGRP